MVVRPRSLSGAQRLRLGPTGLLQEECPILRRCSQVAALLLALVPVAGLRTTKTLMTDVGECLLMCVLVPASSSTTLVASSSTASSLLMVLPAACFPVLPLLCFPVLSAICAVSDT